MSTRPLFSVVIPTRNRASLVGRAIQTVLDQTCDDFEVIVADNDDSEQTSHVVRDFCSHRLRYFRTGGLPMAGNWEFGMRQATGFYTTVLPDKSLLKRRALERIAEVSGSGCHDVVSWYWDAVYDTADVLRVRRASPLGGVREVTSDSALRTYLRCGMRGSFRTLPRALNSCIHDRLAREIRRGPLGRLCPPACPDYTFAFLQLANTPSFLVIDEGLMVVGTMRHGTGQSSYTRGTEAQRFVDEVGGETSVHGRVPVAILSAANCVANDYVAIREAVGGRLLRHPLWLPRYFAEVYEDVVTSEGLGVGMQAERHAWLTALRRQTPAVIAAVATLMLCDRAPRIRDHVRRACRGLRRRLTSHTTPPKDDRRGRDQYLRLPGVLDALAYLRWEEQRVAEESDTGAPCKCPSD